jgi:hypothetical protein
MDMPRRSSNGKQADSGEAQLDLLAYQPPAEPVRAETPAEMEPAGTDTPMSAVAFTPLIVSVLPEPFHWFAEGERCWEVRRCGRDFTERDVLPDRPVEIRRAHRGSEVLKGTIVEVLPVGDLASIFERVSYSDIIPVAASLDEAVQIAHRLLGPGNLKRLIAFKVMLD